jgi:carboxyl-terminal processing protease
MADEGVATHVAEVAAVQGMLSSLDPNTAYLSPEALRLLEQDQAGSVEGIGALVSAEDHTAADPAETPCPIVSETCRLVVVSTYAEGPARLAGLEVGDVLVAVDGESILGWTVDEVTANVRGPAGTRVELRVDRDGRIVNLSIVRAAISIPVVETDQVGDVGYLRLNLFSDTSDRQVHEAIEDLLDQGTDRLVLDLRDNPGGALGATVAIASEFLADGIVVRTEGPEDSFDYHVDRDGLLTDATPMVILVNQGSASASEVLAAALQERDRALVIGTATFGKNTVQQRYGLSDGGALKLTVARWVTEAGSDFGGTGVLPDIEADLQPELTVDELVAEVSRLSGW